MLKKYAYYLAEFIKAIPSVRTTQVGAKKFLQVILMFKAGRAQLGLSSENQSNRPWIHQLVSNQSIRNLYEIRQPPTSLCTTPNFLMVAKTIMIAMVIMVAMVMVVMLVMVVVINMVVIVVRTG